MQETISATQMSVLFFVFMTGSSIINIPGPLIGFAQNGAWISLILSLSIGMILLSCVLFMYRKYPSLSFIEYSRETVGNGVTILLAIPLISILFQIVTGIVLDIGLFMSSTMMRETPTYVFNSLIFLLAATTVRMGIEAIARMFLLLISSVILFIFFILALASLKYHPEYLLPIMPFGIKPIILGAYFTYGFPYVELIVFTMLLPFARKAQNTQMHKGLYTALLMNGFGLMLVTICTIMLFGPVAGDRRYTIYELARTIEILEVFQRIESLIGISLIITSYMKATIALFVLNLTFTHLFKLQDSRLLIFPLALVCFLFTINVIVGGEARWVFIVSILNPLWASFGFLLPLLVVTAVAAVKR